MNKKIVLDHKQIAKKVRELGEQITRDYAQGNLRLVGVLNGAFIFAADLARFIPLPLEIDFIKISSYGADTSSSGRISLDRDIDSSIAGCDIVVVEDIVDTGNTLIWLKEHLAKKNPRSIKFCTLIDKQERREHDLDLDYTGFNIPHGFLIGYGLDHGGLHRNLPDVYELLNP